jgi:hypothetical protein
MSQKYFGCSSLLLAQGSGSFYVESRPPTILRQRERERDHAKVFAELYYCKSYCISRDKMLLNEEKALFFGGRVNMNRKRVLFVGNVFGKRLKAYRRTFKRKTERKGKPSLLQQSRQLLCRFRYRFNGKNIKIREAPSAAEEAADKSWTVGNPSTLLMQQISSKQ